MKTILGLVSGFFIQEYPNPAKQAQAINVSDSFIISGCMINYFCQLPTANCQLPIANCLLLPGKLPEQVPEYSIPVKRGGHSDEVPGVVYAVGNLICHYGAVLKVGR